MAELWQALEAEGLQYDSKIDSLKRTKLKDFNNIYYL